MKEKTRKLQFLHKGMATLLLLLLSTIGAWATDVVTTYSYESSASKAVMTANDYFSAASNPTATAGEFANDADKGLKCTLAKNTSGTVTFTFTAKASVTIESFTFNSCGSSNNILNATVDYYKNSETPASENITFNKSSLGNQTITPDAAISLANGDVLTIKVNLSNTDTENARNWFIKTISLTPEASGSTYTVTYNGQSPDDGSAPTDTNSPYAAGSNVTVLGNTGGMIKSYKDFVGWNTSTSGTVSTHYNAGATYSNISSDVTFYAVWHNRITYSVAAGQGSVSAVYGTGGDTYYGKSAGATFTSGDHVPNDVVLTFTAIPAEGYHFDTSIDKPWGGTSYKDNPITWTVKDTKGFDAHFAANTYTVTIDENTGSAGDASVTATYDAALPSFTAPTKAGNTLSGYYTETSGGTKIINANGTLVTGVAGYTDGSGNWKHDGDVKLYAQWTPAATYSVTYNANLAGASGSVTDASTYEAGASVTTQANSFSKSGYTFLGWSTSDGYQSSYTTAGNNVTMVAGGLDLYAQWQIDNDITVSPEAGSTLTKGGSGVTSTASTGSTIHAAWGNAAQDFATVKASTGKASPRVDGMSYSDAGNTKVLSLVSTDGTFYSGVQTFSFVAGTVAPVISCSSNTVTITSETDGATIRYTTDGTDPTMSKGTVYSDPFTIETTTTVKAIAYKNVSSTDYVSSVTSQVCEYGAAVTTLPVTFDFTNTTYWPTSTDFSGANQANLTIHDDSNNHEIVFHGTSATEFDIDGSGLEIGQNGATNHFIAIPISGINGRIDIDVWAPYSSSSTFKIRGKLDTANTTAQTSAGSLNTLNVNKYEGGHFNFRIKDISATEGVLYIGRNGSSYPCIEKIRITTAAANLVPDKASVFMGDAEKDTTVVTITNNTPYNVLVKTVPSYVNATYEPSTGKLTITPKAVGSGENIELCVDTDGNGVAGDTDLSIPVTVTGITNVTAPTSAVYDTSSGSYSPALAALSVTATKSATGNTGTLAYQWYSNTVNSNTGGTVISGATSNTLSTDKISTTDSEKAAFYYCVVSLPGDSCKSVASDVAYVLTSKSKRYFHMSNVAGNRQTSDESEKITGEIVAGGTATAIHGAESYYRYITRPSSSYAHMYVVSNANNYIKINLKNAIATDDVISVLQMGNQGTGAGIKIATDANGSNAINIYQDGTDTKTYSATFTAAFNGVKEIYILGKYEGHQNYFTDLYISKPVAPEVSAPSPAEQTVAANATPSAISVTATLGTGSYTYQWKQCATVDGEYTNVSTGTGGTTASYTPAATATLGTTYYKCVVTSGGFTTTSSAASVTVASEGIDYFTLPTDSTYTVGKCVFNLTRHNSGAMFSAGRKYWYINDVLNGSATADYFTNDSTSVYMKKDGRAKSIKFYVKGASGFKIVCASGDNSRTYKLTIDGDVKGDYNPTTSESEFFALNSESGSTIIISNVTNNIYIKQFIFYEYEQKATTLTVQKDGETVTTTTQYLGDVAAEYEVSTNGNGTITAVSGTPSVATVSYNSLTGILTVTPVAEGTSVITITHPETSLYEEKVTTLTVTVKKHTLKLAFSYDKATFKASSLTENDQWNTGSLPVLTITRDGEPASLASYTIHYETDEKNVAYFGASQSTSYLRTTSEEISDGSSYRIRWGGSQGGARIYAYVTNPGANVSSEVVYFDLVVEAGTSNNLPKGTHPTEQDQFELQNSEGVTVVTLTYGGYKYKKENGWSAASAKGKYYIDGYANYTRHDLDSYDEYGYQLKGMSDEATGPTTSSDAKAKYSFNTWSSQNVGAHKFWYTTSETKPVGGGSYSEYERIRPFTLPCRGGYLKFEPKQTGKLTVYVWQNGVIGRGSHSNQIGSKPRLGYWFDAEGWVQTPSVDPVSKQPISNANGRDTHSYKCEDNTSRKLDGQMDYYWTEANGDDAIIPALRNKYCDNAENPNNYYAESGPGHTALNPYYWPDSTDVVKNNELMIPKKMKPYKYHNGYFVPEDSYVKYVLNVVAGKTYYFQGMMTKIGYVGMNFVEDESVFGASFGHNESLHLRADNNMATVVSGQSKDITVYDEVTLPSNYKKNQWSTICLPFALSESQVEEAFGKGTQLTLYNGAIKKSEGIYTVKYLSHVDRNILPGQAYFIRPTGVDANGDDLPNVDGKIGSEVEGQSGTRITFNTVCIDKTNFSTETSYGNNTDVDQSGSSIGQEGYVFVGAYNNETLPKYSYIVSGGLLRQFTGTTKTIPTYYAYLKPNTPASQSGSYSLGVEFADEAMENTWGGDQEATGLEIMKEVADAMNRDEVFTGKAYNMMGQEIDPRSAKGMVIINGKKIMK